jgi:hypothetical protein
MKFDDWFQQVQQNGKLVSQQFFDTLEKVGDSPQYTEDVVEWMKTAYEAGMRDNADRCAWICDEQARFLLRFSQFGSNAAKDCANLIREVAKK